MLISLDWIKDFVDLPEVNAHDLGNDFTMKTAEVEEITEHGAFLNDVRVAQIVSLKKHPEADKLNLVTFNFGEKETKEVVCGAPNVREGLKVPYAPIGTTLPGPFTLVPKKIRGILSEGMLCSAKELEIGEGSAGLMELPEDAPLGQTMAEFLNKKADVIIDVDNKSLTHRPDLWGMYGLAREFAAIYDKPLKDLFNDAWKNKIEALFTSDASPISPKVESDSCCHGYWGLSMDGVTIEDSPAWMQERLNKSGLRPINNIVDISNYVMLELGSPLHIFDRDLIEDNTIHIKRVGSETTFETLDEIKRDLIPSDTVICDSKKPLVIAGIMGGANSGVNEKTSKIFIEVANWKAQEVRLTSTRLGLRTDSSSRFEKSLDSTLCYRTLLRTIELVKELCPGAKVVGKPEFDGDKNHNAETLVLKTSIKRINSVLGKEIEESKILSIFKSLDFAVENNSGELSITVPSYRKTKDVECEADLIEEIGRMIGYDNIDDISPAMDVIPVRLTNSKDLQRKIQDFMMMEGKSLEIMTYPLVGDKLLTKANWPAQDESLVLVNALSKDADRMRPSLVPSILEAASKNTKQFDSFSFFEVGRSYIADKKNFCNEKLQVAIAYYSKKDSRFLDLINHVEKLLNYLKVPFDFSTETGKFSNEVIARDWMGSHPHEFLNVRIMGKFTGALTTVHPLAMRSFKMKGNLSIAILDFSMLENKPPKAKLNYKPINKFPVSTFDCSVVADIDTPAEDVLLALKKVKIKEFSDKKIVDVFKIDDDKKSVTIRTFFEDPEKTLSPEFIKAAEDEVVKTLDSAGYPLKQ